MRKLELLATFSEEKQEMNAKAEDHTSLDMFVQCNYCLSPLKGEENGRFLPYFTFKNKVRGGEARKCTWNNLTLTDS